MPLRAGQYTLVKASIAGRHRHQRANRRASTILAGFHKAAELVGKAVILSDGKAGTVERVWLDELHGLSRKARGSGHNLHTGWQLTSPVQNVSRS